MDRPKKRNYEETFDRSALTAPARLLIDRNENGKVKQDKNVNYSYIYQLTDETLINLDYLFANDIDFEIQPAN